MTTSTLDRPTAPMLDTPVQDAPLRPRISDAIRDGAQYHAQGRGQYYCRETGTTCALGALAISLLGPSAAETTAWTPWFEPIVYERTGVRLDQALPGLVSEPALRPLVERTGIARCSLMQAIAYLNDAARWSREEIADWLEARGF